MLGVSVTSAFLEPSSLPSKAKRVTNSEKPAASSSPPASLRAPLTPCSEVERRSELGEAWAGAGGPRSCARGRPGAGGRWRARRAPGRVCGRRARLGPRQPALLARRDPGAAGPGRSGAGGALGSREWEGYPYTRKAGDVCGLRRPTRSQTVGPDYKSREATYVQLGEE